MSTTSTLFLTDIIDNQTKEVKTAQAITKEGDWNFFQLGNYTLASPLVIAQGSTAKITFNPSDISYTVGSGFTPTYDFTNQKFLPQTLNDVFLVETRMKVKCSLQNGHGDLLLESPSFAFNPVQAQSINVPKAANTQQFASVNVPVFIGQDIVNNGLEVKWSSVSGAFSLYDISFMIVRISSGK